MIQAVWLVRHGNREDFVDPNWKDTAERPFDPSLSPDGFEQAKRTGERLVGEGITHIFSSPYLRTVQTASEIAEVLDLRLYLEPGLGEWLNADWFPGVPELLAPDHLKSLYPRIDLDYSPQIVPRYPESVDEALARAGEAARRIAGAYAGTILMVGHGASVTGAAQGLIEDLEVEECALCSIFKLAKRDESWIAELCGDVSHLDHSEAATRFN